MDDFGGVEGGSDGGIEEVDGVGVYDDNVVVRLDVGLFDDVNSYGERFDEGVFLERYVVG